MVFVVFVLQYSDRLPINRKSKETTRKPNRHPGRFTGGDGASLATLRNAEKSLNDPDAHSSRAICDFDAVI
jgi:hypothetical protein